MSWVSTALLLSVLLIADQSSSVRPSATQTVTGTIADADSGQPLSNAKLKVQLFPPENGARKFRSLLCVPNDDAQPLFSFEMTADSDGSFSLTAPGGPYLIKLMLPQRHPIFGCIFLDSEASLRGCGVDPSSPAVHQHLFVRAADSIPGFSGDILTNSACAAYEPSSCDPLHVPNLVTMKKIILLDSTGKPMGDARLEFHEYTKGKGKFVASLTTDAGGIADVSSLLKTSRLLRMSIRSSSAPQEFLIEFSKGGNQGQQTIRLFNWHCRETIMRGIEVEP